MDFKEKLKKGKLLKRYKRFFADIEFEDETLTAHLPNTGSLKTVPLSDTDCFFSTSDDPKRKLKYTLELIKTQEGLVGVNTRTPNTIVLEALKEGLKGDFKNVQPEVKINEKTRIDFVLWNWLGKETTKPKKLKYPDYLSDQNLELYFIEVKNVTMKKENTALFPDGVTERGTKHLNELIDLKNKGFKTEILYVAQREGVDTFSGAPEFDPVYVETLKKAQKAGVEITAFKALMTNKKVCLDVADSLKIKI